jgi:hypothetical protein
MQTMEEQCVIQLTQEEKQAIEPILQEMSEAAKHSISLDALLTGWSQFVIRVEQGYSLTIDDYTNDLSIRNLIQRIHEKAPQSLQIKLDGALQTWDSRFTQTTRPLEHPLRTTGSPGS